MKKLPLLREYLDSAESGISAIKVDGGDDERREKMKKYLGDFMNKPIAVCDVCKKEISRGDAMKKEPCGHPECPFGILRN